MRSTGLIQIGFLLAEPSVRAGEQKSVAKWDSSDACARLTTVRFDACGASIALFAAAYSSYVLRSTMASTGATSIDEPTACARSVAIACASHARAPMPRVGALSVRRHRVARRALALNIVSFSAFSIASKGNRGSCHVAESADAPEDAQRGDQGGGGGG